jgi:hypothetical protein
MPGPSLICCPTCHFFNCRDGQGDISQTTQDAIRSAGHELEYLPLYSPDLNQIEHKWAQAKKLRREKLCAVDELFSGSAL